MEKDILALISESESRLSKNHRLIAQYIKDNLDKAAFMNAKQLSSAVGVSEATVIRFAAKLGFKGYPSMRKTMQEMARNHLTSVQRIAVAKDMMEGADILKAAMTSDMEKLRSTLEEMDRYSFDQAVEAIVGAKHLYIVGMRSSASLASFLGFYMNLLVEDVRLIYNTIAAEVYEQLIHIGPGDVYVGISYPRYSASALTAMQFAKEHGATVIALTDNQSSPFVDWADICLYAKSDMVSFLDSLVAPLSVINALIVAVAVRKKDSLAETFNYLERLWSEYGAFTDVES